MRIKMNTKSLVNLGLVIVFLYCGVRTLMTLSNAKKNIIPEENNTGIGLEPLLHNLEQSFLAEADTIETYDVTRNPLSIAKPKSKQKSKPKSSSSAAPKSQSLPRLTGLILDESPVAIMEIGGVSTEVKIGDLVNGGKVIHINEQGVHVLIDGKAVVIR